MTTVIAVGPLVADLDAESELQATLERHSVYKASKQYQEVQTKQLRNDEQAQLESDEQFSQKNKGVAQWRSGAVAQWRSGVMCMTR